MFTLLLIILLITIMVDYILPVRYWKRRRIPFENPLPLFGNLANSTFKVKHLAEVLEGMYNKFSDSRFFMFFNFRDPVLVVRDLELIKKIMVKDFEVFYEHRAMTAEGVDPLWNNNLFAVQGLEKWKRLRATLSPSFTGSKMRIMFGLMNDCAKSFVNHYFQQGRIQRIDVRDVLGRYSTDVIATTAFGIICDSHRDKDNEFFLMGLEVKSVINSIRFLISGLSPAITKIFNITIFNKRVSSFFRKLIKENIKVREEKGIVRPDMIHLLLEARKGRRKEDSPENVDDCGFAATQESEMIRKAAMRKIELTDDDIVAQALVFFLGGSDTVAALTSFTAVEIAVNPDVQEKLAKEIGDLYKRSGENPSYEDILGLKYLDMVVSETLRKWPPAFFLDRKVMKPYAIECEQGNGIILEKGQIVWIPAFPIHRDPNYFQNPDKFDPERFNDENKVKIKPFTYMPFGLGPRNCIGSRFALLEAKVIFYHILAHFQLVLPKEAKLPLKLDKRQMIPTLDGGCWLELRKLHN